MSGLWEDIKNAYFSYNGMGTNVFSLFVAIFYFLIINKKRQRNLLIYEIFGILFLMTPGIANGILNMSGQNTDHWMVYGILNIVAVVGVVMTDYLINIPTKKEKIIVIVIYILLLQAGMGLNYTSQHLEFITNSYKISNEVMEIAEQLEFVEKPRVLAPEQVAGELREYDTRFAVIYGEGLLHRRIWNSCRWKQIPMAAIVWLLILSMTILNFLIALDLVKFIIQNIMKYMQNNL